MSKRVGTKSPRTAWPERAALPAIVAVAMGAVTFGVLTSGCGDEATRPPETPKGALHVSVLDSLGTPVTGATVWLRPSGAEDYTGQLGDLLLRDLEPGDYIVWAERFSYPFSGPSLIGSTPATIAADEIAEVVVSARPGDVRHPSVTMWAPWSGEYSYADSLHFEATAFDMQDGPASLRVIWTSDRDGLLHDAPPTGDGRSIFRRMLSAGDHRIEARVIDSEGLTASETRTIRVEGRPPFVRIRDPRPDTSFAPGDTIHFEALVRDAETPPASLLIEWSSDRDGTLDSSPAAADSSCGFTTSALSEGVHRITLRVTDTDGGTTSAVVSVRNTGVPRVRLLPIEARSNANVLTWLPITSERISALHIYRREEEAGDSLWIAVIENVSQSAYEDRSIRLGQIYHYSIRSVGHDGAWASSNSESVTSGIGIPVGAELRRIVADPSRPWLYALSATGDRLYFIDIEGREAHARLLAGRTLVDLDLSASGSELYAVDPVRNELVVIDPVTRRVAREISFENSGEPRGDHYHVAAGRSGRAYVVDAQWAPAIHVIDTDIGAEVGLFTESGIGGLCLSPDRGSIFAWYQVGWGAGQARSRILRIDCTTDQLTIDAEGGFDLARDPTDTPIVLSADGGTVFCKDHAYPTDALTGPGVQFREAVYAVAPDGGIVFTEHWILDGATAAPVAIMPVTTRVMASFPDGSMVVLQDTTSYTLYLYELDRSR